MLSRFLRNAILCREATVLLLHENHVTPGCGIPHLQLVSSAQSFHTIHGFNAKETLKVKDHQGSSGIEDSDKGSETHDWDLDHAFDIQEREAAEKNVKRRMSGHRTMYGKAMKEAEVDDELSILEYYVGKAQSADANLDEAEDYDVVDVDKKLFFKMIDLWIQDAGETRRGHREFITVALNNIERFNVQHDPNAYMKILNCFPQSEHTGLRRNNWFKAVWQDKILDHEIGGRLVSVMQKYKVVPNDEFYDITKNLFGVFSRASAGMRSLLFWYPRLTNFVRFPVSQKDLDKMSPAEIALYALRNANPSLDAKFEVFAVDSANSEVANSDSKLRCLISTQTRDQKDMLKLHNPKLPVFVEGPSMMFLENRCVQYYTLRGDPTQKKTPPGSGKLLTDKEWWGKFYNKDFQTSRKLSKNSRLFSEKSFLPTIDMIEDTSRMKEVHDRNEIKEVSSDTKSVEGPVYAIAATDLKSVDALRSWVFGLEQSNPVLSELTVLFNEKKSFLTDGNHSVKKK